MAKYYFEHKKDYYLYLMQHLFNPTCVKVDRAAYFIWAFYVASMGRTKGYPSRLCRMHFVAHTYGPETNFLPKHYQKLLKKS